jgi:endonuclease/exonuclease/phosphatase family metal-dependent hydrolase
MGSLRICTWNIRLGLSLEQVLETIATQAAFSDLDVLALQEASQHAGQDDSEAVARQLGEQYRWAQVTAQHFRGHVQANGLIWNQDRLRHTRSDSISLPFLQDPQGLGRAERWLLKRLQTQRRGGVVLEALLAQEHPVRVYSVHADVLGFAHRLRQLAAVLSDNAARPQTFMAVIAADLNTFGVGSWPAWQALHLAASGAGFKDLTREVAWTHEVPRLRLRQKLDFIFLKGAVDVSYRAWTLPSRASDHLPLFVELSWK